MALSLCLTSAGAFATIQQLCIQNVSSYAFTGVRNAGIVNTVQNWSQQRTTTVGIWPNEETYNIGPVNTSNLWFGNAAGSGIGRIQNSWAWQAHCALLYNGVSKGVGMKFSINTIPDESKGQRFIDSVNVNFDDPSVGATHCNTSVSDKGGNFVQATCVNPGSLPGSGNLPVDTYVIVIQDN